MPCGETFQPLQSWGRDWKEGSEPDDTRLRNHDKKFGLYIGLLREEKRRK